jgi:hypothetical protein
VTDEGGTVRTSTIYIGVGKDTHVFQSVDEVPPELRRKLAQTTAGGQSVSIVIADERGKAELSRAIQGLPSPVRSRLAESLRERTTGAGAGRRAWSSWRVWVEIALAGGAGLAIWLAFTSR